MRPTDHPIRPAYPGGKNPRSTQGIAADILDILPYANRYIEPFAGMLGILLARRRSKIEVANDLDGRIVNWWRVVRDHGEELQELLQNTPCSSRQMFDDADDEDHEDGVRGAYFYTLKLLWGFGSRAEGTYHTGWNRTRIQTNRADQPHRLDIGRLKDRLQGVVVEHLEAVELLRRSAKHEDAVIYCDPPYPTATKSRLYRHNDIDRDGMSTMLLRQKGEVMISGYGEEWDHLGWNRLEIDAFSSMSPDGDHNRIEVVWMNYDPEEAYERNRKLPPMPEG